MILTRFFSKVQKTDTCWLWIGGKNTGGYGSFTIGRKRFSAHRWYYELVKAPIEKGLELDHLCRVRECVNPEHLELVTRTENTNRGIGPKLAAERQLSKTHCPRGHEYTEGNTSYYKKNRRCLTCHRNKEKLRRQQTNKGE